MNVYDKQLADLKKEDLKAGNNPISVIVIKESSEDNVKLTLESLYSQLFVDFKIVIIDWSNEFKFYNEWKTPDRNTFHNKKIEELNKIISLSEAEYIFFVRAGNFCTPHMLLEFTKVPAHYDAAYSDAAVYNENIDDIYQTEIKPDFSYVSFFKHLYTGQAVMWKKTFLVDNINKIVSNCFDTILRELFILLCPTKQTIYHIPLILLLKKGNQRNCSEEKKLIPLLQKKLIENNICGKIISSTSYNNFCFEISNNANLHKYSFLICVEDCDRTCALLLQLNKVCKETPIYIGVKDKISYNAIYSFCVLNHCLKTVTLVETGGKQYGDAILQMAKIDNSDIQIIIRDSIQWCNKEDIERFLQCFAIKEIMGASPQIATATTSDGQSPKIVYAGAGIHDSSLYTELFKGRSQNIYGELDLVWTNREITLLSSFCFAVRKEIWDIVGKIHSSIKTPEQFVIELSLILKKYKQICEYAAQSSFWLGESLGDGECLKTYIKTGCYWHWLYTYSKQIKEESLHNIWIYRSWKTHLNTNLEINVEHVKEDSVNKRILVYTHELSLTGAPVVLIQAVKILKRANYDILVLSPVDGPLKQQYLDENISVIIDPILYDSNNWLLMASDFDLIIVNTVVPYKSIELLENLKIPVLWWLHDSRFGYKDWLRFVLPNKLSDNIHVYAVSSYAKQVMLDYRPQYHIDILPYGLADREKNNEEQDSDFFYFPKDKVIFANIGQIMWRKGQDVLIKAIKLLDIKTLQKCCFIFVGSVIDKKIYKEILVMQELYPDNIIYIEKIPHEHMNKLYKLTDVVICSSRDDPLPTFITEALLNSVICICSENTGFYGLFKDGVNGFLYENNNTKKLSQIISDIVINIQNMENIKSAGYTLYKDNLSIEAFEGKLLNIIRDLEVKNDK